jgi:pimeloyl-ACP methyl ester carboxylesterase
MIAGHSRGAALAARFVLEHPEAVSGLILMATSHPRDFDLSRSPVPVLKIMGVNDGTAPLEQARARQHLLPAGTRWVEIEGGNHSQFAHYHYQLFDGPAGLAREAQQARAVDAITEFVQRATHGAR